MSRRLLLLLALLLLAGRWAWITTATPYGWRYQADSWRSAVKAAVGIEEREVSLSTPEEQARFWLTRLQETPQVETRADLSAGAALLLNAPHPDCLQRYLFSNADIPGGPLNPLPFRVGVDYESGNQAVEEFHRLCGERCLTLAARATELEPDNKALWQIRALTLFALLPFRLDVRPRNEQWETMLAECVAHDPDNALYDYLAAAVYWQGLHTPPKAAGGQDLVDAVQHELAKARAYFQAGLKKGSVTVSPECKRYVDAFLGEVAVGVRDQLKAAQAGRPSHCLLLAVDVILRQQQVQIDWCLNAGDTTKARAALADTLRLAKQLGQGPDAMRNQGLRAAVLTTCQSSAQRIQGAIAEGEGGSDAQLQAEIASLRQNLQLQAQQQNPSPWSMSLQIVLAMTQLAIGALLAVLVAAAVIAATTRKHQSPTKVTVFLHGLTWVGATALSFLLLGVFPGRLLPEWLAIWTHRLLLFTLFAAVMWGAYKLIRRYSSFSLPLLAMPAAIVTAAAIFGIVKSELWGIKLVIPERVPEASQELGLPVDDIGRAFSAYHDLGIGWALYQWYAHSGIVVSRLGVLAVVVAMAAIGEVRRTPGGLRVVLGSGKLRLVNAIAAELQRSAFTGLMLWAMVYFAVAPAVMVEFVSNDQP